MHTLLYTSAIVLTTSIVTVIGVTYLIDARTDREQQLSTEIYEIRTDLALIYQRLEEADRTNSTSIIGDSGIQAKRARNDDLPPGLSYEALRDLVRNLIQEERSARFAATRETQWQRLRHWQDNREGPYGKYNVRVNSLTKTLDLDYTQASYYHTLLSDYEEQANALYEGVSSRLADQESDFENFQAIIEEIEAEKRSLDATFDQVFVQTLSPEQAGRYEQLPPEERGVGPNAGLERMQFKLGDLRKLAEQ